MQVLLAAVLLAALTGTSQREIDVAHSKATFSVTHVFVEHVTGTVPIESGTVVLKDDSTIPVSVSASLDATGFKTDDADRDASLRSPDWFDTEKFPHWTFTSTKIVATGATSFTMDGTLTMHGVAQPEELHVTIAGTPDRPVYHATGTIDRHAFGMKGTRLDPAIGNPVDVTLDVAVK